MNPLTAPIGDFMTKNPRTIEPDRALTTARAMMANSWFRHIPVVEDGKCVGVLSSRDIVLCEGYPGISIDQVDVRTAMTPDPITCGPETSLEAVLELLENKQINCIPIVENEAIVGIFTSVDLVRVFRQYCRSAPQTT